MKTNVLSGIDALIQEIDAYGDTKLIAARKKWTQFIANGKKVTKDDVAFFARGRGQSPRGLCHKSKRPDYIVIDDLDDDKTNCCVQEMGSIYSEKWQKR